MDATEAEADFQRRRFDAVVKVLHWNWAQRTPGSCSFDDLPERGGTSKAEFYQRARDFIDACDALESVRR